MRSALFVDFDNVFSGLSRLGPEYAEAFARYPSRWLDWLVSTLAHPPGAEGDARRRILVRRCYLNPEPYKRFRIGFSRAGFEIVDCPPMTSAGKTSTDIHMVLDMVDVLQSSTRYDEFIVFSADADFTPLLRKLRREDRRTTIFAAGATSASYDASADLIIDPDAFIGGALGFDDDEAPVVGPDLPTLMAQSEAVVWRMVEQAPQPVSLPALTKALATQVPGLVDSHWAGKGTFFALLKSLSLEPLRIDREINSLVDPRRLPGAARAAPAAPRVAEERPVLAQDAPAAPLQARAVAPLLEAAGLPALERGRYRLLLEGLSLAMDVQPASLTTATKVARDHCVSKNAPISRQDATTVMRSLIFNGFDMTTDPHSLDELVAYTCGVVSAACQREGVKVSDEDRLALVAWMTCES